MTQPRRGLGRGLDALFGGGPAVAPPPPPQRVPEPEPAPEPAPVNEAPAAAPPPVTASPEAAPPPAPVAAVEAPPAYVPPAPPPVAETPVYEAPPAAPPAPAAAPVPVYRAPEPEAPAPSVAQAPAPPVVAPAVPAEPAPTPVSAPFVPPAAAVAAPTPSLTPSVEAAPPAGPANLPQEPARDVRRGGPDEVDIDLISPNPEQPRTNFEPEKLRELADSISEHGIIQPLVVSRDPDGGFRLIAGERRLQAARLAGLAVVPVVIRDAVDSELLELALIENIQRADLNAIEEAMAYRRLTDEYGMTQEEAARRVGKSRAAVANALRLLQLEPEIRRSLVAGEITEGHARALLGLADSRNRMNAWREVVKRALTVRDTEGLVRRTLNATPETSSSAGAATARRDATIADIEARLRRALSTRVSVLPQRKGAKITIECYSAEEFEHVIDMLIGDEE